MVPHGTFFALSLFEGNHTNFLPKKSNRKIIIFSDFNADVTQEMKIPFTARKAFKRLRKLRFYKSFCGGAVCNRMFTYTTH